MTHPTQEVSLVPATDEFLSLPFEERKEILALLHICMSVEAAKCRKRAIAIYAAGNADRGRGFSAPSLRRKFYAWIRSGRNWVVLRNESRVREGHGLPLTFVDWLQGWCMQNKRVSRQQWFRLKRYWVHGCDDKGEPFVVPGYGTWQDWWSSLHPGQALPSHCPGLPRGWSYENLMRKKHRLSKAQEVMARQGIAPARAHLPHVLGTREGLRFLEQVTFDDVKVDFRVLDPVSGTVCDLWLLVAFDRATAVCLGYGMRPARVREDGTQEHLRLIDMKQLCGWVLERWGLPPYPVSWKLENGCATLPEATALALRDLSGGRIGVSYASMISGKSAAGYQERGIGNSRAKASHEAHNNLLHNIVGDVPGQTGRRYDVRPADLAAREAETRAIWAVSRTLSPEAQDQIEYSIYTLNQARTVLNAAFHIMNTREQHELEGFDEVVIGRPHPGEPWRPVSKIKAELPLDWEFSSRRESPVERMKRLITGLEWSRVPRSTLVHFYRDSHKRVCVNEAGEITFAHEKRDYVFVRPADGQRYRAGDEFLAYFHPRELDLLHLTQLPPHGGYVASWARRDRVRVGDGKALSEALEYTKGALQAEQAHLHEVCKPEAQALQAMRAHNAEVIAGESAIQVRDMNPVIEAYPAVCTAAESATAAALDAIDQARADERARAFQAACQRAERAGKEGQETLEKILTGTDSINAPEETNQSGEELLQTIIGGNR